MTEAPKKKLIEVALPLEEINAACKADKDRKTGTIRNLHKWFAPAPLPAWRALLFAALVDDPGDETQRAELLELVKRLVVNGADLPDPEVLDEASAVLARQFPTGMPTVMDPFCGGGSTLVEAQRLGLPTYGSDLNPVPVLITRTLTELLPKVHGQQPIHPEPEESSRRGRTKREVVGQTDFGGKLGDRLYTEYGGLIQDVGYYAEKVRAQAWEMLKDHYPCAPGETPTAWLWARTATCPNPACRIETLLTTSWWLSKKNADLAWTEPRIENGNVVLAVVSGQTHGTAPESPKNGRGTFACLKCGATLDEKYLRSQGKCGGLGIRMTAVVAEVEGKRIYREPASSDLVAAESVATLPGIADTQLVGWATKNVPLYGIDTWDKLYTPRQLLTLSTFADLVGAVHQQVLDDGGTPDWADAITTLLGLAVGKLAQYGSSQTRVELPTKTSNGGTHPAFPRNDLPMTWDFGELMPFREKGSTWLQFVHTMTRGIEQAPNGSGTAIRIGAQEALLDSPGLVATDPPYFDAIGYADLSDYFYVWHRRALRNTHPDLYSTVAAPKASELTAIPSHHGGSKEAARTYFINGFTETFTNLQRSLAPGLPMLVIYASKEQKSGQGEETRWESILTAMVDADLEITGAWPIHMTSSNRMISIGANAVAAYIAMVCRPRPANAPTTSLNDLSRALRRELPTAIRDLQSGSILPVDLRQAALGPGMRIYSRYRKVEDSHGDRVPVGKALELIRNTIGEVLDEQVGDLDAASRFAVTWWDQFGWQPGPFGVADKIARQYGTTVDDVFRAEVVTSGSGKVQLLGIGELDRQWTPEADAIPTAWEAVHHLADRLINGGGESEAAALLSQLRDLQDSARALAYRLHDIAAEKGWAKDQERYNALIGQWTSILALAATHDSVGGLF